MSAGLVQMIVGVALPTVKGSVPLALLAKFVPPMVAEVKEAATLWVPTERDDGL